MRSLRNRLSCLEASQPATRPVIVPCASAEDQGRSVAEHLALRPEDRGRPVLVVITGVARGRTGSGSSPI